jgi:hypothetical protein
MKETLTDIQLIEALRAIHMFKAKKLTNIRKELIEYNKQGVGYREKHKVEERIKELEDMRAEELNKISVLIN